MLRDYQVGQLAIADNTSSRWCLLQLCLKLWHGGNVPEAECYYMEDCTAHK